MASRRNSNPVADGDEPQSDAPPFDYQEEALHPLGLDRTQLRAALTRVIRGLHEDHLDLAAAGVAFYGLLGMVPGLASAISLYGLIADPRDATRLANLGYGILPSAGLELVREQLTAIAAGNDGALTTGVLIGTLFSIWSANRATKALFTGLNVAYREAEKRDIFELNAVSLAFTFILMVSTVLISAAAALVATEPGAFEFGLLRWALLGIGMLVVLSLAYRFGPSRRDARWQWISVGSVSATTAWMLATWGFGYYVDTFGAFGSTFGTLGAVACLMTWFWLSALIVILGAKLNGELEHTTLRDTTVGPDRPLGSRGAFMADDVPESERERLQGS